MSGPSRRDRASQDAGDEICAAHRLFDQGRFTEAVEVFKRYPQHPIARYLLGEAYERAPEYESRRYLALIHYFAAVDELPDWAAIRLANCYANGLGVVKSKSMAVHWYLIAGHSGDVTGYINAASLLWKGGGDLHQNRVTAYAYMFAAGALNDKEASNACLRMIASLTSEEEEHGYAEALIVMGQRNVWRTLYEVERPGVGVRECAENETCKLIANLISKHR